MKESSPSNETLDAIGKDRLTLLQPREGYRFSLDSLLLWGFLRPSPNERWVDLGSGCGILSIALAKVSGVKKVYGLEIQSDLVELAHRNASLNGVEALVTFQVLDIRDASALKHLSSVDAVCTNPPYYPVGTGRLNPHRQKAVARHEIKGTLADFICAGRHLLKRGGLYTTILPSQRFQEAIQLFTSFRFSLSRIRPVHPYREEPANLILIEALKEKKVPSFRLEPPLVVYSAPMTYSPEVQKLFSLIPLEDIH